MSRLDAGGVERPVGRRLDLFTGGGYDPGSSVAVRALWVTLGTTVVRSVLCPNRLRIAILRWFGATVGDKVKIRHDVTIHWPWKLTVGDASWLGVGVWLLNLEPITIGRHVCVSQGAFLCTGSHQRHDLAFEFDNRAIRVDDGAWVAARATVLPGVCVGANAVIGATALVTKDVHAGATVLAPPAEVILPTEDDRASRTRPRP